MDQQVELPPQVAETTCGDRRDTAVAGGAVVAGAAVAGGTGGATNVLVADRERFDLLYREQFVPLVRLAALLSDNRSDGPDVVHEAFVKWYARRDTVREPGIYLRTVVVNIVRGRARRSAISRKYAPRLLATERDRTEQVLPDPLFDVVAHLPLRQRSAVVLRFYEGRSEAEIARILDCRPGTVKSMLSRAMASMRAELSEIGSDR